MLYMLCMSHVNAPLCTYFAHTARRCLRRVAIAAEERRCHGCGLRGLRGQRTQCTCHNARVREYVPDRKTQWRAGKRTQGRGEGGGGVDMWVWTWMQAPACS